MMTEYCPVFVSGCHSTKTDFVLYYRRYLHLRPAARLRDGPRQI